MKIESLTLENFRSFKESVTFSNLSDVNVLVGANNVGKSNVLEALRYIQSLANGSQLRPFKEIIYDCQDSKRVVKIKLTLIVDVITRLKMVEELFKNNSHVIGLNVAEHSNFFKRITFDWTISRDGLASEIVSISNFFNGDIVVVSNTIEGSKWRSDYLRLDDICSRTSFEDISPTLLMVSSVRSPAPNWALFLTQGSSPAPIMDRLVLISKEYLRNLIWLEPTRQAATLMPLGEDKTLNPTGNNLVRYLFTLQNNDPESFQSIVDDFLQVLPEMKQVLARLNGGDAVVALSENNLSSKRDLSNVSSGLIQTLILIGLLRNSAKSLYLIEEPEIHLHATSQRKLFEIIHREACSGKQFFLTTHSTIFAHDYGNSVFLITKKEGAAIAKKITDNSEYQLIKESLGHINGDLFNYNAVVFVEGESEELALPIIAQSMFCSLTSRGIYLLNVKGASKFEKLAEYLTYLKGSGVTPFIIADNSERLKTKMDDWSRQGLLPNGNCVMWDKEFEDCFEVELIVEALNNWLAEEGVSSRFLLSDFDSYSPNLSIAKRIELLLSNRNLPNLDKPALAEQIAKIISKRLQDPQHVQTCVEKAIEQICRQKRN